MYFTPQDFEYHKCEPSNKIKDTISQEFVVQPSPKLPQFYSDRLFKFEPNQFYYDLRSMPAANNWIH